MSAVSLNNGVDRPIGTPSSKSRRWIRKGLLVIGLPLWVLFCFEAAQFIVLAILLGLKAVGVPFHTMNVAILQTIESLGVYGISILLVVMVPVWIRRIRTTRQQLGLARPLIWTDIFLAPAGFVVYLIISAALLALIKSVVPGLLDTHQAQSIGFSNLSSSYEYVLAFITLVVLAPIAEETLFRGYLYGKVRRVVPFWAAVLVTSILFAALHLPSGGAHLQWDVAFDVFALSLVLCSLRELTGNIYASILLHMMKNGLAFYLLFINPSLGSTIGK